MELVHATGMQADYCLGTQVDGRELLVTVIKGTFDFPRPGAEAELAPQQEPLVFADTFSGAPGLSAPVYESDFAPRKPRCDVLLLGCAHAPNGRPATRLPVSLQVGAFAKAFMVVGDRWWMRSLNSVQATAPRPFLSLPIVYERAFGGKDARTIKTAAPETFRLNPVGRGFCRRPGAEVLDGLPLPNTEEAGDPYKRTDGTYRPMAFGPVGRNWLPRSALAGTYDADWQENVFPALPEDFDEGYHQSAPADQQIPYPRGGEPVLFTHLTPEGRTGFRLPKRDFLVWYLKRNGEEVLTRAVIDTLIFEPEARRFMVVWRSAFALKRDIFEVEQVVIGEDPEARARRKREMDALAYPAAEAAGSDGPDAA
jgi:hypothetical protein